jgi:choice-of-anchor B domain-containing protein
MKIFLQLCFFLFSVTVFAQEDFNIELVSQIEFNENSNDIWGYVDATGLEYAIVGTRTATRVYSLEDPANPVERAVISGAPSIWRDIKSNGTFLYVTTDQGTDGLTIIDMTLAPETITSRLWQPVMNVNGDDITLETCHNLYIDDSGTCYLAGCNTFDGVILLDITTDPLVPSILGTANLNYSHDVYARGDRLYSSEINIGEISIYDISDKTNPIYINGTETTSDFTHNAWLSDDGNFVFTTDERGNSYVDAYDISDESNLVLVDKFRPIETENNGVVPHNTHYLDGYLVTSWYTDGIVIVDAHEPNNLIKVGSYDTFDGPHGGTNGCWGAYPFLPSGIILASDISTGLYILQPEYKRAAYLEGNVRDISTLLPINMVEVEILGNRMNLENTDPTGFYRSGQVDEGTFMVRFSHPDYLTKTVQAEFVAGEIVQLDVELDGKIPATLSGIAVTQADGSAVPFAHVFAFNEENSFSAQADADGNFSFDLFQGTYTFVSSSWGFLQQIVDLELTADETLTIELERGYQDDFIFDLGWSVSGTAPRGIWELATPVGTDWQGLIANPNTDYDTDQGSDCYVTGNDPGTSVGSDDVDNGNTILESDFMELSSYNEPTFNFALWFFNESGNNAPDDEVVISVNNGTESTDILTISSSASEWNYYEGLTLPSDFTVTDEMKLFVETADAQNTGNLVEAGFDTFLVTDGISSSTTDINDTIEISASPNPFSSTIALDWSGEKGIASLYNIEGKIMASYPVNKGVNNIIVSGNIPSGNYLIKVRTENYTSKTLKLVKI